MSSDYLARPLIEGMQYEISDAHVAIQSPHTCFVNHEIKHRYEKDALLCQYRRVLDMAKTQGIRISYTNHIRKTLQEQWPEYESARRSQERLFNQLKKTALEIQARGIHFGTTDDEMLSALLQISGQLTVYGYSSNIISRIANIGHTLSELEQTLSQGSGRCSKIFL